MSGFWARQIEESGTDGAYVERKRHVKGSHAAIDTYIHIGRFVNGHLTYLLSFLVGTVQNSGVMDLMCLALSQASSSCGQG